MHGWWCRVWKQPILTLCVVICLGFGLLCRWQVVLALEPGRTVTWHMAPLRIQGHVAGVQGAWVQVADRHVYVPSLVRSQLRRQLTVGDSVSVTALSAPDGSLVAAKVVVVPRLDMGYELRDQAVSSTFVEFSGYIEALPNREGGIGMWQIDDVQIMVDVQAQVDAGLAVGDLVDVSASERDGAIWAAQITAAPDQMIARTMVGQISDLGHASMTLQRERDGVFDSQRIRIDERTFFDESQASAAEHTWAEVRVVRQPDGTFWAKYVRFGRSE